MKRLQFVGANSSNGKLHYISDGLNMDETSEPAQKLNEFEAKKTDQEGSIETPFHRARGERVTVAQTFQLPPSLRPNRALLEHA
jgi:hypothetical protein